MGLISRWYELRGMKLIKYLESSKQFGDAEAKNDPR